MLNAAQSGLFAGLTTAALRRVGGHATLVRTLLARGARDMADQSVRHRQHLPPRPATLKCRRCQAAAAPTEEAPPTKETPRFKEALDYEPLRHERPPKKFVELKVRRGAELMAQLIRSCARDSIAGCGAVDVLAAVRDDGRQEPRPCGLERRGHLLPATRSSKRSRRGCWTWPPRLESWATAARRIASRQCPSPRATCSWRFRADLRS